MKKSKTHWVGLKEMDFALLIAACNAVAWKQRTSKKLQIDALAMAIRLDKTYQKLPE